MNVRILREFLRPIIGDLKDDCTNSTMPALCAALGMPVPGAAASKRERMYAAFDALQDSGVPNTAQRLIDLRKVDSVARNSIQELLWADFPWPEIPKRYRRDVARAIERVGLFKDGKRFDELLERIFVFPPDPISEFLGEPDQGLWGQIQRHVHAFPGDWSVENTFDELQAFDVSDRRFGLLLEGLASSDVRTDVNAQYEFVVCVNEVLRSCGAELREVGSEGGYPVFAVVSLHASTGRPKNLIFASPKKPDIRFRDAVNNDIEIVSNADAVLVYDRPIGSDGLRWKELQQWWAESRCIADETAAKTTLYRRLLGSLPEDSPPQTVVFDAFYRGFGPAVPDLPALLPEVWLHWDPKTARERGTDALLNHRMDFLLLLPASIRVVIEVDGKFHYADATSGRADPARYAKMVAGDRELKLAGYEVYRFGAAELQMESSQEDVRSFFEALFRRYGVTWSRA